MSGDICDLVIVGAGQGGLSVSYYLCKAGIGHVVLDRGGIGHAWETRRWDSFCLVTPNWTIDLPGRPYDGDDRDGFMTRDSFVRYIKDWANGFGAPVKGGVDVARVTRENGLFAIQTSSGPMRARNVVIATATYQYPRLPSLAACLPGHIRQLHAEDYKNCGQAAEGAVMVVGSGQTGCQIVEDFLRAGYRTYLCVAQTGRLPRRYRGRDCISWQDELGLLDRTPDMLETPGQRFAGDPHVTGRDGGSTVSLYDFHRRGVTLLGRLKSIDGSVARFRDDLQSNLEYADAYARDFMKTIDDHVAAAAVSAPAPTAAELAGGPDPAGERIRSPRALDLDAAGVATVIWATGFAFAFGWIEGIGTDEFGYPLTDRGRSTLPGLYFCGLNWMTKRKSGILYGVGDDARAVSSDIIRGMSRALP